MYPLVPSILENTLESFLSTYSKEIKLPVVERIQVDFGDGIFVPNKILDINEIPKLDQKFEWEAHLMVTEPKNFLEYKNKGFKIIIVHFEAYQNTDAVKEAIAEIKSQGLTPALCLNNETAISVLKEFEKEVKHFQLMSVKPGFQGTPFLENTYERIKELRTLIPDAIIEVDGGVKKENLKQLIDAGADLLILGSVITKVPNMQETYESLQKEI